MGFGSFIKKAVKTIAPVAGSLVGGPAGMALGTAASGLMGEAGNIISALQGYPSARGTAADPNTYVGIRLPGIEYPEGMQLVDYPDYPDMPDYPSDMPLYGMAPQLEKMPVTPVNLVPQYEGERLGMADAQEASRIYRALLNPSDPRILSLAKEEQQLLRNDFLRGVQDLSRADRRNKALGREGLFSGERGAENLSRILTQNAQDTGLRARLNARAYLTETGNNLRSNASTLQNLAQLEAARKNALREDIARMVGQMREDAYKRTDIARTDYVNRLGDRQKASAERFNVRRDDMLGKYKATANKILDALRIGSQNNQDLSAAQGRYVSGKSDYQREQYNTIGRVLTSLFNDPYAPAGQVVTTNQGRLPWRI